VKPNMHVTAFNAIVTAMGQRQRAASGGEQSTSLKLFNYM
jgi:hypothetical protein